MSWWSLRSRRCRYGIAVALLALLLGGGVAAGARSVARQGAAPVPLSVALSHVAAGTVRAASVDDGRHQVTLTLASRARERAAYPTAFGGELSDRLLRAGVRVNVRNRPPTSALLTSFASVLLVAGLLGAALVLRRRAHGVAGFGRGRGRAATVPDTRFADLAGCEEAVEELREVTEFLHRPERFTAAGARLPKGFLLVGPPGTGKTLLARAVAGEAGVPFFALSGSDFVETYVGVGAARVRSVFDRARSAGRAIVFIDEIDAVGKARTAGPSNGSSDERENTLNQLLVEMDGFAGSAVIVLAATNRADTLDQALLRPGRFDRRITVAAPDRGGRQRILALHAGAREVADDVDLGDLARRTPGMSGADLAYLVNEAALEAARHGHTAIARSHLDRALATAMLGRERRSALITERDRRITAWHEAGHAVCALVTPGADRPVQVTIIPRGEAGGVTWMSGSDHSFCTRSEAEARLVVALGGRCAEERLLDGDYTQGAAGDYRAATDTALRMVTQFGMSDLGVAALLPGEAPSSEARAEVRRILDRALDRSRGTLDAHADLLAAVAARLLEEETLEVAQLEALRTAVEDRAAAPVCGAG